MAAAAKVDDPAMTRSSTARLRRLWLNIHLWIGVGLLVALVPLSVSGAILVWRPALDHGLHAERYAVSGPQALQPVSAYAQAATDAFGARARLTQLRLPSVAGDPVVAVGRLQAPLASGRPRTLNAWIDPPSGRVLATAEIAQDASMVIHRLHGTFLIPGIGRKVVGWCGWAMFVSSATGLWLWWPRHGAVVRGLRWRRGSSKLFNLHHMVGFWMCLPLAVLSLTGVYISFPQAAHALFGIAETRPAGARRGPDPRFAPPLAQPQLSVDQAVQAAQAAAPDARVIAVTFPQAGKAPAWRVELSRPGAPAPSTIRVADATGEARSGRDGTGGGGNQDPLSRWMRRIHDGADMGPIWRTIITLAGVAPLVLSLSGVVMWLRRRTRRLRISHATGG
jgi:uncharacterized iron-regulated membrane protein